MDKKRFKCKVGVLLVVIEDDEILLLRRYNTGIADGVHVLPMGCIEEGESATQAMIREPHKCYELRFYPLKALPQTLDPFVRHGLECILSGESYSEFGWPSNVSHQLQV